MPMRALTHADLAAGLPPAAKEWIELPMIQTMLAHFTDFRLRERDHNQFDL